MVIALFLLAAVALVVAGVRLRAKQLFPPAGPADPAHAPAAPAPDEEVAALVRDNKLIEAIKVYREKHGVDLRTAKNAVEKMAGR